MTKAELVKAINELAANNDLKPVTTRPKKSILETVLAEYQDIDMANAPVEPKPLTVDENDALKEILNKSHFMKETVEEGAGMESIYAANRAAAGIENIGGTTTTKEESDKEADSLFNMGLVVVGMCIVFVVVTILALA